MRVAHDRYIHDVRGSLPGDVELLPFDPASGPIAQAGARGASSVRDPALIRGILEADALLIRTVTRITPEAFPELESPGRRLSFIGSATAGVDHVDAEWLESLGIRFAHSPGCNATAVAEYVATGLLAWLDRRTAPHGQTDGAAAWSVDRIRGAALSVGVLGAGHAGGATARLLSSMGCDVRCYDPPRSRREPLFQSCGWDEIAECDVLTLHVPLTHDGEDATQGWITPEMLAPMRARLVIQACRGGVLVESDTTDLICDVWEGEPAFSDATARHALLATPHIAGYSFESKHRATAGVCDALIRHAGLDGAAGVGIAADTRTIVPEPVLAEPAPERLTDALKRLHPMWTYDQALRSCIGLDIPRKTSCFHSIRDTFPLRREFGSLQVRPDWMDRFPILEQLGIRTEPADQTAGTR